MRLDDVRMDEVELGTPVGPADLARLKLGDVVYISGVLYTARESVYRKVVEQGVDFPASVRRSPTSISTALPPRPSGRMAPTRRGRHGDGELSLRQIDEPVVRALGREGRRGQGGLTELAYREWFVPHGALYLTTVGYGMGAAYGRCIKRVVDVHWLAELGIAQALWVLEVERLGPFLVEGDREGKSLFAVANREINLRLEEVYRGLPPYAMDGSARPPPGPTRSSDRSRRAAGTKISHRFDDRLRQPGDNDTAHTTGLHPSKEAGARRLTGWFTRVGWS